MTWWKWPEHQWSKLLPSSAREGRSRASPFRRREERLVGVEQVPPFERLATRDGSSPTAAGCKIWAAALETFRTRGPGLRGRGRRDRKSCTNQTLRRRCGLCGGERTLLPYSTGKSEAPTVVWSAARLQNEISKRRWCVTFEGLEGYQRARWLFVWNRQQKFLGSRSRLWQT